MKDLSPDITDLLHSVAALDPAHLAFPSDLARLDALYWNLNLAHQHTKTTIQEQALLPLPCPSPPDQYHDAMLTGLEQLRLSNENYSQFQENSLKHFKQRNKTLREKVQAAQKTLDKLQRDTAFIEKQAQQEEQAIRTLSRQEKETSSTLKTQKQHQKHEQDTIQQSGHIQGLIQELKKLKYSYEMLVSRP